MPSPNDTPLSPAPSSSSNKTQNVSPDARSAGSGASRRSFLRRISTLAAGGTAAAFASGAPFPAVAKSGKKPKPSKLSNGLFHIRRAAAKAVRYRAALNQSRTDDPRNKANGDETAVAGYAGNFTKALPHNALGEVDPAAFESLLHALKGKSAAAWETIPLGGVAKLANPQASLAFSLAGGDSHAFSMPPAPAFSSAEEASEMAEVYLHALARDVPFDQYGTDPVAAFAAGELNAFSDFRGPKTGGLVTPQTLFRGSFDGDLAGNYVSQFLLMDVPMGAGLFPQRYETTVPGDDHMLNQTDWLNILQGGAPTTTNTYDPAPRYITSARHLGEYVHRDYTYQTYLQAALILFSQGAPLNPNNPYQTSATQGGFVTFGAAEILSLLGEVTLLGLKAAWYQKWQIHRRVRPEVFAGRVHHTVTGAKAYPVNAELLGSNVLNAIQLNFGGGYWLPMAYPEGSPTHPAYPAGHAVISGACTTVLKALFNQSAVIADPVEVDPLSDGTALQAYSGPDTLTVGGELNKLANNIAIGRNLAGVHWRTDGTEGVLLGEDVAVRMLRDAKLTYPERFDSYSFTGFRGNTIVI